jgi:hypothetical protein
VAADPSWATLDGILAGGRLKGLQLVNVDLRFQLPVDLNDVHNLWRIRYPDAIRAKVKKELVKSFPKSIELRVPLQFTVNIREKTSLLRMHANYHNDSKFVD